MRRVTIIVLDSLGIGQLPDAAEYKDTGADTLGHIVDNYPQLSIPNLQKLGFGNISGAAGNRLAIDRPTGSFGKAKEKSKGKDTITGHWEIAGIYTDIPFKTYPDGFPKEFISAFEKEIGRGVLGNYPASGTEIIDVLGEEHEATGKPIVYTSADSVFQIAANVDVISTEELYDICATARKLLVGDWACGRIIARPYTNKNGKRERTPGRKDYSVSPPVESLLDKVKALGLQVCSVGKISDIFNDKGITRSDHTTSNMAGVDKTIQLLNEEFGGLIFTNLVDFDTKYGHRRDPVGYGKSIEEFDQRLPELLLAMKPEDILYICADHGTDPVHQGWDHTREYIPIVVCGDQIKENVDLGVRESYADIGATSLEYLGGDKLQIGDSFLSEILR
ncbi:MAG: phosphopentomutase [Anaerovoracaceae bacterium]